MSDGPFPVRYELAGWALFARRLTPPTASAEALGELRDREAAEVRERFELATLSSHPTVAALRRLFRAAGCDPTRYRPSSEALLRRLLKGDPLPAISPLVDLNNCLSVRLAVPCCVMDERVVHPPYVLRAGQSGESYESLRGPFNLESKPLLADEEGPCDAPITGSQRVKVGPDTPAAWLVAYLPADVVSPHDAGAALAELLSALGPGPAHG